MNKVLKYIIFLLSMVGVTALWYFLNDISNGNVTSYGLGDFIIMYIGFRTLVNIIGDTLFYK